MKIKNFFYFFPRTREKLASAFILALILLLPKISLAVELYNPLGDVDSFPELINNIISGILGVVGAVALVMMVIGGITWMTSAGNADRVRRGRDTLLWAILGLVIIFLSYAIINFVFQGLQANPS